MPSFQNLVLQELGRAKAEYPKMTSLHEGYAILLEEVEELWAEIKKKPSERSKSQILQESIQVGAMIQRLVEDCEVLP